MTGKNFENSIGKIKYLSLKNEAQKGQNMQEMDISRRNFKNWFSLALKGRNFCKREYDLALTGLWEII
jgi:hypothetical protein